MTRPGQSDEDMPAEIDFSGGVRGKFYRLGSKLNLPVFENADVEAQWAMEVRHRIAALDAGAPTTAWAEARKKVIEP